MDIIAQEFKTPGNLGAIVRSMKNFEFDNLILLNPKCNHLDKEALDRATHAKDILKNAKIVNELKGYDTLIGTTAKIGTDYNLHRTPISPEELGKLNLKGKVGLIIGRENDGMRNEELESCDIIVSIPSSKKYPTMNASHATTILMYEIFKHSKKAKNADHIKPASREDKEILLKIIDEKMKNMEFKAESKKLTQKTVWRKVIGKSNISKRELQALFGFFKKIQ